MIVTIEIAVKTKNVKIRYQKTFYYKVFWGWKIGKVASKNLGDLLQSGERLVIRQKTDDE